MFFLIMIILHSNLSHAHRTHLTHAQTYVNDNNRCQKHGWIRPHKIYVERMSLGELLRDGSHEQPALNILSLHTHRQRQTDRRTHARTHARTDRQRERETSILVSQYLQVLVVSMSTGCVYEYWL